MSDIIRVLPDSVANQIAAGEVIQSPSSVIKELVENSVDAGATSITIIVKDSGRTLIQVVDNGSGMSDTDARLSFERHATSKITKADDLFALHTMGFRGEALASIAAISQVDIRTMKQGASIGTRLIINGSKVESQKPEACVPGTNMMVKNLFFNVPARRKFLRKDAVEMSNIMREYERLALVNTSLEFTLIHNDVTVSQLRPGTLKQRVCDLFGKSLEKQLIPVEAEVSFVKISGFISLPEHARRRNVLKYFFVNGRNMRHLGFHKALMQCYESLISPDSQPCYFLNFEVDPASIDVNIHPTKHEIKFENEREIWQVLVAAVKESLGKFNAVPSIDFDVEGAPEIPVFDPNAKADHHINVDPDYNPFKDTTPSFPSSIGRSGGGGGGSYSSTSRQSSLNDWEKLYADFNSRGSERQSEGFTASAIRPPEPEAEVLPGIADMDFGHTILQLGGRYIITPSKSGMMVVDRHRAHVLVLYERYLPMIKERSFTTQKILFPETINLTPSTHTLLTSIAPTLLPLGFELSYNGEYSWTICGIPSELGQANAADTVMSIIENVAEGGNEPGEKLYNDLALAMARSAATNAANEMTDAQADQLLADLLRLPSPTYTPDGLKVLTTITLDQLSRLL